MTGEKKMFSSYEKNQDPKERSHSGMEIKVWSKDWVKLLDSRLEGGWIGET
jgi:hypothetical protein